MTNPAAHIFIDADACPVRDETYKVAIRHQCPVTVVSNGFLRVPQSPLFNQILVDATPDAADDVIADQCHNTSVVITADILLAGRCLQKKAIVLAPNGKPFTDDSIGGQIAARALMNELREGAQGENLGGPAAFSAKDRSAFLQSLHEALVQLARRKQGEGYPR